MIRNHVRFCAALALLGTATALIAAPPSDEQVDQCIKAYDDAMAAQKPTTFPEVKKIATEALGDISVEEMSAGQIGRIFSHAPLLQYADAYPKAQQRLRSFMSDRGADGAIASAILFAEDFRAATEDATRLEVIRRTLGHPAFDKAVQAGVAGNVLASLGRLTPEVAAQASAEITSLERFLTPEYADNMARAYIEYLEAYAAAAPDRLDDIKRVRERMATLATEVANNSTEEHQAKFYKGVASYLNGAFARGELVGYKAPEVTITWSSDPSLSSLGALKGQVVILDFWATWCGPCVGSFPNVRELVEHYKGYPVKIVGVTSLQGYHMDSEAAEKRIDTAGNPQKEYDLMASYLKSRNLTWPVVFSAEEVFNPEYGVRGIPHVAIIGADGKVRHNGLHPADPLAHKCELIDALLREAGLPTPPPPPAEEKQDGNEG